MCVFNHDGFAALKALLPPEPRRALVLIDPSYEMREDYTRVPECAAAGAAAALRPASTWCGIR
jgi:23S rRNA (adenine2030-N6)-methyltransferase